MAAPMTRLLVAVFDRKRDGIITWLLQLFFKNLRICVMSCENVEFVVNTAIFDF